MGSRRHLCSFPPSPLTMAPDTSKEVDVLAFEDESLFLRRLPYEIRVYVYRLLGRNDVLNMRIVNHQIKMEIERNVDFAIRIDDQICRFSNRLRKLRVDCCTIVCLTRVKHTKRSDLWYPDRVKRLIFDGTVRLSNLNRLLASCTKVEELTFTHQTLSQEILSRSQQFKKCMSKFTHLTHLNLQFLRYPLGDPFSTDDNITLFLNSTFQNLRSLKLYYSLWGNWTDLFNFLIRHNSINSIELQVGDRADASNTSTYLRKYPHDYLRNAIDTTELRSLRLVDFRFRDDVLSLNPTVKSIMFDDILSQQTSLETLHFHSPEMSLGTISSVVAANEKTLKELVLYNLRLRSEVYNNDAQNPPPMIQSPLDIGIFSKCSKLKFLDLSCGTNSTHEGTQAMEITRMNLIPQSLERLQLTGFKFNSEEIVTLSHNQPNLRELRIMDAGKMKYSTILTNILKNCPKLEYICVSPLTTRGSSANSWLFEVSELNKLYLRFMNIQYMPDDLDGFEATHVNDNDREWIKVNMESEPPLI